jgi:plasmid stabilization system protein ParE
VKYRVELTENARQEADAAYEWLAQRTVHAAAWFNGLADAIEGLAELPTRWSLARESAEFDEPVRQLLYGTPPHIYRVLFIVRSDFVYVLHVRHGARQALERDEVAFPPPPQPPH